VAGAVHPCSALFLANIVNEQFNIYQILINNGFNTDDSAVGDAVSHAEKYVLGLFLLAIFAFFPFMIQSLLFTLVGETMTEKIRKEVYHKLLRLPVGWFEKKENRGGLAATRFGVDSHQVNSLVTSLVSTVLMNSSAIVIGLIIAFVFEWRLGLVGLVAMPAMVSAGFISMLFYGGFGDQNKEYYDDSSKLAEEGIVNMRTVYSTGYQGPLFNTYSDKLRYP
jgi:ATP-binding cassette, subfamily B (MDR/TAP), member 1